MSDIEQADRPDRFSAEHRLVGGVRVVQSGAGVLETSPLYGDPE
ncbi:hypothetical protein [Streptomyces sp. NPDC060002]